MVWISLAVAVAVLGAPASAGAAARHAARPDGPRLTRPGADSRVGDSRVRFAWRRQSPAVRYELRLSRTKRFSRVTDLVVPRPSSVLVLADGVWWWKVRTIAPRVSRWSDRRRLIVTATRDVIAPTRPVAPRVTQTTTSTITVAFGASRDSFGVARYEIVDDRAGRRVVARVGGRKRTVTLPLACSSPIQTLRVRAVDRAGNRSLLSPPARGRTRPCPTIATPPPPPSALRVTTNGPAAVSLAWDAPPASVGDYLVSRDGIPLGRPRATTFTAVALAAATRYVFSVQARDVSGRLSDPALLEVTTSAPPQTVGSLHAHVLTSDSASIADFQAHYRQVGWVYLTDYDVLTDAFGGPRITGTSSAGVARWAQRRGIKVLPRFHSEDTGVLHAVLADPAHRDALVRQIARTVTEDGADGANIDFESGYCPTSEACDRDALTAFVQSLAAVLHEQHRLVSVDVSARTSETASARAAFYDYAALGRAADEVLVMAWNPHYSTSMPGPVADAARTCGGRACAWTQAVADYAAALVPRDRLTLATALYAFDWTYRRVDEGPQSVTPVDLRVAGGPAIGQTAAIVAAGQLLQAIPGTWRNTDGSTVAYSWQRCSSYRIDAGCTVVGRARDYLVRAGDISVLQPYLFVVETVRNGAGPVARVAGVRTMATPYRPIAGADHCVTLSGEQDVRVTAAKPVTDAAGVLGTVVPSGSGCLVGRGIAREFSNDLPDDDANVESPFHLGVLQVLARLDRAGRAVRRGVDPLSGEQIALWTDPVGAEHQLWWVDGRSAGAQLAAFARAGFGIGVWRLGREDPTFWQQPVLAASAPS